MSQLKNINSQELSFDNNKLTALLCGEFGKNLDLIAGVLGVEIFARANRLILRGDDVNIAQAHLTLSTLYADLKQGQQIEIGDIEAIIKMAQEQKNISYKNDDIKIQMAKITTKKAIIKARTRTQNDYMRAFEKNELIFGVGPAGTGKTYLAVAYGVKLLISGEIDRIILSRPAVEAGERLGFLPGDLKEKVDPYLRPLYDALYDMLAPEMVDRYIANGVIEIAPLAFMRGRTLSNALVILDEAQNSTQMQMKMFLTRLGENSKMIVTGDPSQIDLPRGEKSGLLQALDLLAKIKGVYICRFGEKDIIRHKLVGQIVKAYQSIDENRTAVDENRNEA